MTAVAPYPGHVTFTWPGNEASHRSGLSGCRMPSLTARMDDFNCSIHCIHCHIGQANCVCESVCNTSYSYSSITIKYTCIQVAVCFCVITTQGQCLFKEASISLESPQISMSWSLWHSLHPMWQETLFLIIGCLWKRDQPFGLVETLYRGRNLFSDRYIIRPQTSKV